MKILVLGGTRFLGVHLVNELVQNGNEVTIATRGLTKDNFEDKVKRVIIDRINPDNLKETLSSQHYDVVFDNLAYCSNNIKHLLDCINSDKYVMTSSTAVYKKHINTKECEFNPNEKNLLWGNREDFEYDEGKRQAESALFQNYSHFNPAAVRFPFVIGEDDYTKRFAFYIEHIVKQIPMFIDNIDAQMSFVRSDEAGKFLAFIIENNYSGFINGASEQTISIRDIAEYVEKKTGKSIVLSSSGEAAPYNLENEYSINVDIAKQIGFTFSPLKEWVYDLIDSLI